jgi:RNA polymerase sigma-70 factor (ECF subfamily)
MPLAQATALGEETAPVTAPAARPTLEQLFQRHAHDVGRLVTRLLGPGASRADAEDLTQQIFLAAHRALPRFRGESQASTWLYGIATRLVYREIRGWTRRRRMIATLESMMTMRPSAAEPHDRAVESRQELARVWRHLLDIDAKKRLVLILHDLEGLTGREIAQIMDIKEPTVHTRLFHARRELMARLERAR